ncbi:chaplin family protein [Streptomyces sp. NPDC020192]|uniref:chaplin n=1 Tax=Streptomyces sp. NPDC020192 TaxID=3365066 RepID=UPI0037BE01F7
MRQTLSKGMVVAAAATGMLSLYGGSSALADSNANGITQGSAGVLSGNSVQAPVNVPVNVCGNSVDVVGALNPAFGNSCANEQGSPTRQGGSDQPGTGSNTTPPSNGGDTSPPPNRGGETTSPPRGGGGTTPRGGGTTPRGGDSTPPRSNTPPGGGKSAPPRRGHSTPSSGDHTTPTGGREATPPAGEHHQAQPPTLAHTGGEGPAMLAASAAGAALMAAGTVLYRRGRAAARR